jgi:hypothetical protein
MCAQARRADVLATDRGVMDNYAYYLQAILDRVLPTLVPAGRLVTLRASEITSRFDWFAVLARLAASVGATVAPPDLWR